MFREISNTDLIIFRVPDRLTFLGNVSVATSGTSTVDTVRKNIIDVLGWEVE